MPPAAGPGAPGAAAADSSVIRAVLFDLDDTLFDHRHGAPQALAAVREGHAALARVDSAELERRHAEILDVLHLRVLAGEIALDDARLERFRRLFEGAGVPADAAAVDRPPRPTGSAIWSPGAKCRAHVPSCAR